MTEAERKQFYYSDGRINPDKAFAYILEAMDSISVEEFRRLATTPVNILPFKEERPIATRRYQPISYSATERYRTTQGD